MCLRAAISLCSTSAIAAPTSDGWPRTLNSLRQFERRTRLNESIHLIRFVSFALLAGRKFASGALTTLGLTMALTLNLILGLWPIVLQRYNRLRLYRAIETSSRLRHRS